MGCSVTEADLDWLEKQNHLVDRTPVILHDGRKCYLVDSVRRTEEQVVRYFAEGIELDA